MTAKQTTDQTVHDADGELDEATADASQAESASRQLLAKARYDAFRLMTEARDEAERILDEARAEAAGAKKAAEVVADSVAEKAKIDAAAIVESAREEAAAIVASSHRTAGELNPPGSDDALEAEHRALSQRVSTLRTLADQLEDRFAALAKTAGAHPAEPDATSPDASGAVDSSAMLDYSPSVAPQPSVDVASHPEAPARERGSFYNRRSANLPRLGTEGGQGALDMTRSLRENLETD